MGAEAIGSLAALGLIVLGVALWKLVSFIAWKTEAWLFFRSVRQYLQESKEKRKRKCG